MIQSKFLQLWATKIILWPNSLRKSIKSRRTFIVCLCSFSTPCCVIWLEWKSKLIPVTASASSDTGSLGVANSLNTTSPQTADIWVIELVLAVKFRIHLSIDNMLIGGIGGILFYLCVCLCICKKILVTVFSTTSCYLQTLKILAHFLFMHAIWYHFILYESDVNYIFLFICVSVIPNSITVFSATITSVSGYC